MNTKGVNEEGQGKATEDESSEASQPQALPSEVVATSGDRFAAVVSGAFDADEESPEVQLPS
ncbi:hypothetical protein ACQV5M_22085, partial [Leptospira sp. SA-E8]|uniref:hypothetical protein n=1 Tax=Leptospira sp. SA-E8 TaxID=3422259 RepID=UPI003EC0F17D